MATTLATQNAPPAASDAVHIPMFGAIERHWLQAKKRHEGRIYQLTIDGLKKICETIGFNARFDSPSIRAAHMDWRGGEARIYLEIARNTRPTDIGLRYVGERWVSQDAGQVQLGADATHAWKKSSYVSRVLPEKLPIGDDAQISLTAFDEIFMRVDFKERRLAIIVPEPQATKLPSAYLSDFVLQDMQIAVLEPDEPTDFTPLPHLEGEKKMPEVQQSASSTVSRSSADVQTGSAKYATYSRSEVDQLLRQQAENLAQTLGQKISSQQKTFTEALNAHERTISKLLEKHHSYIEEFKTRLDTTNKNNLESALRQQESFKHELEKELGELRAQVGKGVSQNLKSIEDKVKSVDQLFAEMRKAAGQETKAPPEPPTLKAMLAVVAALTILNTVLLFLKH
ncbi:MAG TPA: hypothetical protein V6D17_02810 [Candidatus Obscuribacterales bacterium]